MNFKDTVMLTCACSEFRYELYLNVDDPRGDPVGLR